MNARTAVSQIEERARHWVSRRGAPLSPRTERWALGIAATVFVASGVLAWRELAHDGAQLRWGPVLAIALLGMPLTVFANASEYWLSGHLLGQQVEPRRSLRVATTSIAANMLPVPGSVLVRMRALASGGATYGEAASSSLVVGLGWMAVTAVVCGFFLIGRSAPVVVLVLVAGGCAAFVWIGRWIRARRLSVVRNVLMVIGIEMIAVIAAALRFWFALKALDVEADFGQAVAVSSSGVLASMAGVFPGGLGLREVLAGALGAGVELTTVSGVAASVVDRLALVVALSPVALVLSGSRP